MFLFIFVHKQIKLHEQCHASQNAKLISVVFWFFYANRCAEELRNRTLSAEHPPLDQRKSSLAFKDLSAHTIAEQLTYLEYRMLRRIPVSIVDIAILCFHIFGMPEKKGFTLLDNN